MQSDSAAGRRQFEERIIREELMRLLTGKNYCLAPLNGNRIRDRNIWLVEPKDRQP